MDKMRITIILILTCIIIVGTTCLAATGIVNAPSGLVLRESPSKTSTPLTTIPDDASVDVIEKDGEWYKVKYGQYEGYLFGEYVKVNQETNTETVSEQVTTTAEETTNQNEEQQSVIAATNVTYPQTVNTTVNVKAYIIPSITSRVILTIELGKEITVNGDLNNWYNITYEGKTYWIRKTSVSLPNTVAEETTEETTESTQEATQEETKTETTATTETTVENKKGYINVNSAANIRESASTSAKIVNTLTRNTEVTIIGESGDFYKIKYKDITGYVSKSLVSDTAVEVTSRNNDGERATQTETVAETQATTEVSESTETTESTQPEPSPAAVGTSPDGERIADLAKQYVGYGYSYGGTNPNSGFDCSGFAQYIYSNCGYTIGRTGTQQLGYGTAVSKDELAVGDLLFFNNTSNGSVGHVGIYIGDNMMVHAANSRRGVTTDTIASGYYNNYYYTARRIAN